MGFLSKALGAIANPITAVTQMAGGSTGLNPVDATLASLPIIGDAFGAQQNRVWQEQQASAKMGFEDAQAQRQMSFQKMMSDTAHQRQVADLKKAGLNPILSANSGAAVGGGASATGAMGSGDSRSTASSANKLMESAYKMERNKAKTDIDLGKQMKNTQEKLEQVHASNAEKLKEEKALLKKQQTRTEAETYRTLKDANSLESLRTSQQWKNYSNAAKNAKDMFLPGLDLTPSRGHKNRPKVDKPTGEIFK